MSNYLPARLMALVAALPLALAACEQAADPTAPLAVPLRASASAVQAPDTGLKVRLLVNKEGSAVLDVSTASFTDIGAPPNGLLKWVKYKLIDPTNKLRYEESIKLPVLVATASDTIPLTLRNTDKGKKVYPVVTLTPDWRVEVEAEVVGHVDEIACGAMDKKTRDAEEGCKKGHGKQDVLRSGPVPAGYNPDLDVTTFGNPNSTPIVVAATGATLTEVRKGDVVEYQIAVSNAGPRAAYTVGAIATCDVVASDPSVTVSNVHWDGQDVGSATTYISAGAVRLCMWTATATTAGSYSFTVTANAVSPLDYDTSNNSITQSFDVVSYAPVGGGGPPTNNPLAATLTQLVWTDAAGTALELSYQSAAINNFALPAQTPIEIAQTSTYDVRVTLTTGNTVTSGKLVNGTLMNEAHWRGPAPLPGTCSSGGTDAGLVNRNNASVTLTICVRTDGVAEATYVRTVGKTMPADVPDGILLYGKYVKYEMTVTRTVGGVDYPFGGSQRLTTTTTALDVSDYRGTPPAGTTGGSRSGYSAGWQ